MGTIRVNGGGLQVVQYRTASGRTSRRLAYGESQDLEVNDSGDQLWVDFCFFTCGAPSAGPCDVLPGDRAGTRALLWNGIELFVSRGDDTICDKTTGDR
jgi:hypothetical protein